MKISFQYLLLAFVLLADVVSGQHVDSIGIETNGAENEQLSLDRMAQSIREQLDGKTVGYAFAIGNQTLVSGSGGLARTSADGPEVKFTPQTRITVASLSKWITAIAAMDILEDQKVGLDAAIGPYFPEDWQIDPYWRSVTFAQLLSHTSGIRDSGNGPHGDQRLKEFFARPVRQKLPGSTEPANTEGSKPHVMPNDKSRFYSNFNFAILRLLLPKLAGCKKNANLETRPRTFALQYERLVQKHVFEPIGIAGPACSPIGDEYAYSYFFPGDQPGHDWGDVRYRAGSAGWYVSAEEMAKVLLSINAKDGRILTENEGRSSIDVMRSRRLGLDVSTGRIMQMSGLWGEDGGLISTSAAIFGSGEGANLVAALLINSDIVDGPRGRAQGVLRIAYREAFGPKEKRR